MALLKGCNEGVHGLWDYNQKTHCDKGSSDQFAAFRLFSEDTTRLNQIDMMDSPIQNDQNNVWEIENCSKHTPKKRKLENKLKDSIFDNTAADFS